MSAVAHEVILALSYGFFYPVLLVMFGIFGVLLIPLTATSGRRYPYIFNLLMWLLFFIGNGNYIFFTHNKYIMNLIVVLVL